MADALSPSTDLVRRRLGTAERIGPMPDANTQMKERTGHSMEDYINAMASMGGAGSLVNTAEAALPSILGRLASLFKSEPLPVPAPRPNPTGFDTTTAEGARLKGYDDLLRELGTRPNSNGTQLYLPFGK